MYMREFVSMDVCMDQMRSVMCSVTKSTVVIFTHLHLGIFFLLLELGNIVVTMLLSCIREENNWNCECQFENVAGAYCMSHHQFKV